MQLKAFKLVLALEKTFLIQESLLALVKFSSGSGQDDGCMSRDKSDLKEKRLTK